MSYARNREAYVRIPFIRARWAVTNHDVYVWCVCVCVVLSSSLRQQTYCCTVRFTVCYMWCSLFLLRHALALMRASDLAASTLKTQLNINTYWPCRNTYACTCSHVVVDKYAGTHGQRPTDHHAKYAHHFHAITINSAMCKWIINRCTRSSEYAMFTYVCALIIINMCANSFVGDALSCRIVCHVHVTCLHNRCK